MEPTNFRSPDHWNTIAVPERVARRAVENIDKQADGCWISRYSVSTHGYAQIGWAVPESERRGKAKSEMVLAHRAAWTAVNGQVPLGVTIDHLCKVRRCVNPDHLRLLPNIENARRNQGGDFPMGECRNGHPDALLVRMARRSKSGERRWGTTCGQCMKDSRGRWALANPEKRKASQKKYDAKRNAA